MLPWCVLDPQVVAHVLWTATSDRISTDNSHSAAATSPQNSPRRPPRHVLLHHDRLAQLSIRDDPVLASPWELYHGRVWCYTAVRRHGLGAETGLVIIWLIRRPNALTGDLQFYTKTQFVCFWFQVVFYRCGLMTDNQQAATEFCGTHVGVAVAEPTSSEKS